MKQVLNEQIDRMHEMEKMRKKRIQNTRREHEKIC